MDDLEALARMATAHLRALVIPPRRCRHCGVDLEDRPGPGRPPVWCQAHRTAVGRMTNHEWAFYDWREGAAHRFFGPPNVPDVWPVKKSSPHKMGHLTEKPVELARHAIEHSSLPGEVVLDYVLFNGAPRGGWWWPDRCHGRTRR